MPTTPGWEPAKNGAAGDLNATNHAAQINQFLGSHTSGSVYRDTVNVDVNGGSHLDTLNQTLNVAPGNATDLAQAFTLPGGVTAISRVVLPMAATGKGGNALVSLCPDSSGSPNTASPVASTIVPGSYVANTGAVNGITDTAAPALTSAHLNTLSLNGGVRTYSYIPANQSTSGTANDPSVASSGSYQIQVGGIASFGGTPSAVVNVIQYQGGDLISAGIAQPALPTPMYSGAVAATSDYVIVTGGTNDGTTTVAYVWVAGWDPNTGQISSWSQQTNLPTATRWHASAADSTSETVYVVGGAVSGTPTNAVYYSQMNNGQISTWTTSQPLPVSVSRCYAAVVGGWLVVAGGTLSESSYAGVSSVYYARINSDGSLGGWNTAPNLIDRVYDILPGWNMAVMGNTLAIMGGIINGPPLAPLSTSNRYQFLTFTPTDGAAENWWVGNINTLTDKAMTAVAQLDGSYVLFWNAPGIYSYFVTNVVPMPLVSVPLVASGLTGGATYHVVIQQNQYLSQADYLTVGMIGFGLSSTPFAQSSDRHSGVWSDYQVEYQIPMKVYGSALSDGPDVLHLVDDIGVEASSSTMYARNVQVLYNSYGNVRAVLESVVGPNDALNSNPTFTSGTSPWTATNATLTQSNAQTHGGFPFSGLLTPTGGFALAYASTERFPVQSWGPSGFQQDQAWYLAQGWFYSPTGTSGFSCSVNWFDAQSNYISTSSNTVTLAAATWTYVTQFVQAPLTAAFATVVPTESGTPTASNLIYMSNVYMTLSPEYSPVLPSVIEVLYPTGQTWPPVGFAQLAA